MCKEKWTKEKYWAKLTSKCMINVYSHQWLSPIKMHYVACDSQVGKSQSHLNQ